MLRHRKSKENKLQKYSTTIIKTHNVNIRERAELSKTCLKRLFFKASTESLFLMVTGKEFQSRGARVLNWISI